MLNLPESNFMKTFVVWIMLAALTTVLCGLVYVAVQQDFRMSANDPQIALAEDAAAEIAKSPTAPQPSVPQAGTDIATSLSPYIIIYDEQGKPVTGSGVLDGKLPELPAGVADAARKTGQDRVTWQPRTGLRQATIIAHYSGTQSGFVMAGRSLREVEKRIGILGLQTLAAWIVLLILDLLIAYTVVRLFRNPEVDIIIDSPEPLI